MPGDKGGNGFYALMQRENMAHKKLQWSDYFSMISLMNANTVQHIAALPRCNNVTLRCKSVFEA